MKRFIEIITCVVTCLLLSSIGSFAHPGRTDSRGGHTDRKTGEYHYHSPRSQSSGYKSSSKAYKQPATSSHRRRAHGIKITYPKAQKTAQGVKVVGFIDGDTIKVVRNGKQIKIRLYGIDTPEKKQAYGRLATTAIKQILTGRNVKIKIIEFDRYGRAVAIVYADGMNVNEAMIRGGHAWVYRKYCKKSFCNSWLKHESKARRSGKALWKDDNAVPPWEWRR